MSLGLFFSFVGGKKKKEKKEQKKEQKIEKIKNKEKTKKKKENTPKRKSYSGVPRSMRITMLMLANANVMVGPQRWGSQIRLRTEGAQTKENRA